MYKQSYLLFFILSAVIFSCEQKQNTEIPQEQKAVQPPGTRNTLPPTIVFLDTCPPPLVIDYPQKEAKEYAITLNGENKSTSLSVQVKPKLLECEKDAYIFEKNYNEEQQFLDCDISCGYKDKKGNLWFGSSGAGVCRYDGNSVTNYTTLQGLAGNLIKSINEDDKGNLWFGSNGSGASRYDGIRFHTYTIEDGLGGNIVRSITKDKKGNIWLATSGGLSRYTENKRTPASFINYTTKDGVLANYLNCVMADRNGNIWCATEAGVCVLNFNVDGKISSENYTMADGLPSNIVNSIVEDNDGYVWLATDLGVAKYNPLHTQTDEKPFTIYTVAQGLLNTNVQSMVKDKEGSIWLSTAGGISKYSKTDCNGEYKENFINFTKEQGLSNNIIYSATEDKTGNLWIGAAGGGLNKYTGSALLSFSNQEIPKGRVWCFIQVDDGDIWLGTNQGICNYNKMLLSNFAIRYLTPNVRSAIQDNQGHLWFGTAAGAIKYDGKSFTCYTSTQGLINKAVLSILQDKKGNIWFGTYGQGACKFDGRSFTNYTSEQGLANNIVKTMVEDKDGAIWFGSNGNGLSKFDGKQFTNYTTHQGLCHNSILSSMKDKNGNLWFGTLGGGVSKFDGKTFISYSSTDGLVNDVVYAIAEDTIHKMIWFGTNLGLSGVKTDKLSNRSNLQFENFNVHTGYSIKDVNTSALLVDRDGIIWIGYGDKLGRFDYDAVRRNTDLPVLVIQAIKIQEEPVIWQGLKHYNASGTTNFTNKDDSLAVISEEAIMYKHLLTRNKRSDMYKKYHDIQFDSITPFYSLPVNLVLPNAHNDISFDFAAIETDRPQLIRYRYMLDGYDKDWRPITTKATASFGNMYEGTYTFKVIAQSPDGVWGDPISYTFKVLPPWYRTWWMYLIYIIISLSFIIMFFRLRTASLRKDKEQLEQKVNERTAEVVEQKELVEEKQKEILDSINYAKRIQYALLAHDKVLQRNLNNYFVLFQPKDIVSGDFYWATKARRKEKGIETDAVSGPSPLFYMAVCDSTGHGVPGAFMSLVNISFLNEAINEKNILQPNEILNHVRKRLIENISQDGAQDGMDGTLLCFEQLPEGAVKCTYSAANNAPILVRNNSIIELAADKMPVGKGERNISFTLHTIDCQKGDVIYCYTDGYADQFGGPKGKKFKYRQLDELLLSIHKKTMDEQKQQLTTTIKQWKGDLDQVDDILVMGIRIG
jgi:ligand-binding sensor domain-containing protein/serine phosphatase RsbU (regulator of sigma subunit)